MRAAPRADLLVVMLVVRRVAMWADLMAVSRAVLWAAWWEYQ